MSHDVFISYSRDDLQQVEPFVKMIEQKANVKCWIDWTGIESGSQFEDVIVRAIDSVKVVLFFVTESSINSHYAKMEVNYAYNVGKKVVPIVLDGGTLRGWFLFKFGPVDSIDIHNQRQCDKLIQNLQSWCGTAVAPTPKPAPAPVKTYKVGDYYNDGVREGVVFEVSANGRRGKIVSITQSDWLQWSSDRDEQRRLIGADSKTDGAYNMAKVKAIPGWRSKYPAFAWCADLGEGWYLPSIEELVTIYSNRGKIKPNIPLWVNDWDWWSSTERDYQYPSGEFCALRLLIGGCGDIYNSFKHSCNCVHAVSAF